MKKVIILVMVVIGLAACDDYFDPQMKGSIEGDKFFKSLNNLRYGLNSVYDLMQSSAYQQSELYFGECMSDNCWTKEDVGSGDLTQLINFTFNTDNSLIKSRYDINYKGINICNQIIRSVPMVEYNPEKSDAAREIRSVYGQAKALRALFYFNLVKTYGGVSIQPEKQNIKNLVVKRSSIEETYAYIEKDLRESILLLLKERFQGGNAGQISVGAGLGLLMKVLMYEASPGVKLNVDKKAKWNEALEIAKYFIDGQDITVNDLLKFDARYAEKETWEEFSERMFLQQTPIENKNYVMKGIDVMSLHGLHPDWSKLFRVSGEYSIESLIEINHYNLPPSATSLNEDYPLAEYVNSNIQPTSELFNRYKSSNDPRGMLTCIDRSGHTNLYFMYDDGRYLGASAADVFYWYANFGAMTNFTKFVMFPRTDGPREGRNYRVMRYAEVLFIYAEILNETGNTRKAISMLNKVRQRAKDLFLPTNQTAPYQSYYVSDKTKFTLYGEMPYNLTKQAIWDEKRLEMALEGDRWFELLRLGQLAERMAFMGNNPPASPNEPTRTKGKYFKKGVNEIFPIPQKEVLISNGIIEQNFGY